MRAIGCKEVVAKSCDVAMVCCRNNQTDVWLSQLIVKQIFFPTEADRGIAKIVSF